MMEKIISTTTSACLRALTHCCHGSSLYKYAQLHSNDCFIHMTYVQDCVQYTWHKLLIIQRNASGSTSQELTFPQKMCILGISAPTNRRLTPFKSRQVLWHVFCNGYLCFKISNKHSIFKINLLSRQFKHLYPLSISHLQVLKVEYLKI